MEKLGTLESIWRFPVKSLAAEALAETTVERTGLPGDRAGALYVTSEHARTGKPYRGKENNHLHLTADVSQAARYAAESHVQTAFRPAADGHEFDDAPVSLVLDRWIDEVGAHVGRALDPLRWRPNFYVRTEPACAYAEFDLVGRFVEIGDTVLRVRSTIGRCVTTTYDVATGERNGEVLGYVARRRNNVLGVYCEVELAGTVRLGDSLRLRAR
ncbi:MAG: MOSC domain-containing protein [Candidatus Eremiobacteraeota bacterium]|nr:MOSC domain-containing protein [Candidatus Eremiobacteraeota bacterium]